MRDGGVIATLPADELDEQELVRMMVGRDIGQAVPGKLARDDAPPAGG